MVSFVVLASGNGTNFQALMDGIRNGEVKGAEIKALISDKKDAYALERAKAAGIPSHIVEKEKFKTREDMDREIMRIADSYKVDYLYLLGYMRLIKAPELFEKYRNRMINLHPSLLPAFPGVDAQHQAFEYGCKVSGITIHFVDAGLDAGPVIYQKAVDISDCRSGDEVTQKLRVLEHEGVKKVAQMAADGKFTVEGRKVVYVKRR
ncbi:MAG: phosphoribosylglycinamide formyltransferase [Candidatus ainarchaeum sp.]|nr:phosphoribosylglycinamide formyltransferase [Candidatus ainarchaeum sp.]